MFIKMIHMYVHWSLEGLLARGCHGEIAGFQEFSIGEIR